VVAAHALHSCLAPHRGCRTSHILAKASKRSENITSARKRAKKARCALASHHAAAAHCAARRNNARGRSPLRKAKHICIAHSLLCMSAVVKAHASGNEYISAARIFGETSLTCLPRASTRSCARASGARRPLAIFCSLRRKKASRGEIGITPSRERKCRARRYCVTLYAISSFLFLRGSARARAHAIAQALCAQEHKAACLKQRHALRHEAYHSEKAGRS